MEFGSSLKSDTALRHRPFTILRMLRGILCLILILSTAFMMLIYCAPVTAVMLRFFSIHYSRKATSFCLGAWVALWPFLFEKINKTKVVFAGEDLPSEERILLIANHRTEVDWMYLWDLALRKGCSGYIKYILKSSLMSIPIFGWVFHVAEFISVERKWEVDASNMHGMLSTFTNPQDPLWLAVFPEGTDFTEPKCTRSQKYAAEKGLPVLKHVLLPKTKGFSACLDALRSSLDAVYDITIGYKHRCPTFMDNVFGVDPSEVHLHVQRFPLDEIPHSENDTASWLIDRFRQKDQLLSHFISEGSFPYKVREEDLSTLPCVVNFVAVLAFTGTCTYLTLFSSIWFRIYVASSCAYLASATYFNIRPTPILRHKSI